MGRSHRSASSSCMHFRRAFALSVLLAFLLGAAVVAAVTAQASSAGGISGSVSTARRVPLQGALVTAYRDSGSGWAYVADVTTDARGEFTFDGLAGGEYTVGYSALGYADEWYAEQWSFARAESITVWDWWTTPVGDARMVPAAVGMAGTVTASSGDPAEGAKVSLRRLTAPEDDAWQEVVELTTDDRGDWSAARIPSGTYKVYVDYYEQDAARWYQAAYLPQAATQVAVPAGSTRDGLDVSLEAGGTVTGTVTGLDGLPIKGIPVELHLVRPDGEVEWSGIEGTTDAEGAYTFMGVPPTTCTVWFTDYTETYLPQMYGGSTYPPFETFSVPSGGTAAGIDAVMVKPSAITGRVTDAAGDPVADVVVDLWEASPVGWRAAGVWGTPTASDGTYTLRGLRAGVSYRVQFKPVARSGLLSEWWSDKRSLSTADTFVLDPEETRGSFDATLENRGTISGTVTGPQGESIPGYVEAYLVKKTPRWAGYAWLDESGGYTVRGLDPGSYLVRFRSFSRDFLSEWFEDQRAMETATPVLVAPGDEITGIDAQLAYSGKVAGTVRDSSGEPVAGIWVAAYGQNGHGGWAYLADTSTDASGEYLLKGLTDGVVRVGFFDWSRRDLLSAYYDGKSSLAEADPVSVATGETTSGIDETMYRPSTIAGDVEDAAGDPAEGIDVTAYRPDGDGGWEYVADTTTDAGGHYRLDGLGHGTYRVGFRDWQERFATEFYADGDTVFDGESLAVGVEEDVTGIDARLAPAGEIAGTVSGEGAGPLAGVRITAYTHTDEDGWRYVSDATTDATGAYKVPCLAAGAYRLYVAGSRYAWRPSEWRPEWYDDASSLSAATSVRVGRGETTGPVDAELSHGATLGGTVTSEGAGAGQVGVTAYRQSAQGSLSYVDDVTTDASGAYTFTHLWGGDYVVYFSPPWRSGLAGEWYDSAFTLTEAKTIVVPDSGGVDHIDAALSRTSSVSGTVTDEAGGTGLAAHVVAMRDYGEGWDYVADATADALSGDYTLTGLSPGRYHLKFVPLDRFAFCTEWWNDQPLEALADTVFVGSGNDLTGYDAALAHGGTIAGVVSATGGDPLPNTSVTAYRSDGAGHWQYVDDATTSFAGDYQMYGIPAGDYRVRFTHRGDYAPQWYDHAVRAVDAKAFEVTAGGHVTGIDGTLDAAAVLGGSVSDTAGRPVSDLRVVAYADDGDGWSYVADVTTDKTGAYRIGGLGREPHQVQFVDDSWRSRYVTQWFSGASSQEDATPVDLGGGTGQADATMLHLGEIVDLTSSTHPDAAAWYKPGDAVFQWSVLTSTALDGYGYGFDASATGPAPRHDMGTTASATVPAVSDGVWYFHVRTLTGQELWSMWGWVDWAASWSPTRSYAVHVDGTAPVTKVEGAGEGWQREDVELTFSAADGTSGMSGGQAKTEHKVDAGSWATGESVVVEAPADGSNDGTHIVGYRSTDAAGNREADKSVTVMIDAGAPVTTVSGSDDAWHAADVALSLSATDAVSGMTDGLAKTEYKVDDGSWTTGTSITIPATAGGANDGSHTVAYCSTDAAGNKETEKTVVVKIDTMAPQTTASGADDVWHRAPVTVTLDPDDAGSGMSGGPARTEYRVDSGSWTTGESVVVGAPANGSNDGTHTIAYRSTDAVGNLEADQSVTVKIDATAPVTSQSGADASWHHDSVTVTLTPADAGSGMAGGFADTLYRVDSGAWTSGTTVVVTGGASHTLAYYSIDNAGNSEAVKTVGVLIDSAAPSTIVSGADAAWHNRPVTLTFTATDADAGVAYTEYSLDAGSTWSRGASVVIAAPAGGSDDGQHTVQYRSADTLGNVEVAKSVTVKIDTVGPRTRTGGKVTVRRKRTASLEYRVDDPAPNGGTATVTIKIFNQADRVVDKIDVGTVLVGASRSVRWKATLAKGEYRYSVYAKDAAGNAQTRVGSAKLIIN